MPILSDNDISQEQLKLPRELLEKTGVEKDSWRVKQPTIMTNDTNISESEGIVSEYVDLQCVHSAGGIVLKTLNSYQLHHVLYLSLTFDL